MGAPFVALVVAAAVAASSPPTPTSAPNAYQAQPQASASQSQPAKDDRGTEKNPLFVKSVESESASSERERVHREGESKAASDEALVKWTYVLAIATIALVGIAVGQFVMFWRQLGAMKEGITEAKKAAVTATLAAEAALSNAETAKRDFAINHRPWISVEVSLIGKLEWSDEGLRVVLDVSMFNTGKTPAVDVWAEPRLCTFMQQAERVMLQKTIFAAHKSSYVPGLVGSAIFPTGVGRQRMSISLTQEDIDKFLTPIRQNSPNFNQIFVSIVGCVSYRSTIDDDWHATGFIYDLRRHDKLTLELGVDTGSNHLILGDQLGGNGLVS